MDKCKHENTVFGELPGLCDYEFCTDCKQSRAVYEQDNSDWSDHETCVMVEKLKADLQTAKDLIHHGYRKHTALQERIAELEAENRERACFEIDATATIKELRAKFAPELCLKKRGSGG